MSWVEWVSMLIMIFYICVIIFWAPANDYCIYLSDIKTYGKEVADMIWRSKHG